MLKRQMSQPCPRMVPQSGMYADCCLLPKHAKKASTLCTGILLRWLSHVLPTLCCFQHAREVQMSMCSVTSSSQKLLNRLERKDKRKGTKGEQVSRACLLHHARHRQCNQCAWSTVTLNRSAQPSGALPAVSSLLKSL